MKNVLCAQTQYVLTPDIMSSYIQLNNLLVSTNKSISMHLLITFSFLRHFNEKMSLHKCDAKQNPASQLFYLSSCHFMATDLCKKPYVVADA